MAKIIRAEFLSYYNSAQNSDKVFNVFLIEEDNGNFSCITEFGRRGNKLVQRELCSNQTRSFAEGKLRQKLLAKRNHASTPYSPDQFGRNYSRLIKNYEVAEYDTDIDSSSDSESRLNKVQDNKAESETNVIEFPTQKKQVGKYRPEPTGILNKGQFDSLEI